MSWRTRKKQDKHSSWLSGSSEMTDLIRTKDWSKTPFGAMENWPSSLKTIVGVALGSRFPMLIWWGPDLLHLYNDAYRPILRDKHPVSLGAPAAQVWAEVWSVAGPMAKSVQDGGPATWTEDLQLFIKSAEMAEETYFTFSYSPIPDEKGGVAGILNTVQETTAKVQGERQIQMLSDLSSLAANAKSEAEAYQAVMQVLSLNELDIPFALLYKLDDDHAKARLIGSSGLQNYHGPLNPAEVVIKDSKHVTGWPLSKVMETTNEVIVDELHKLFDQLPIGRWEGRPGQAIILPITQTGQLVPDAFLIAGISPHRKLDNRYMGLFHAMTAQVSTAIVNARSYAAETKRAEDLAELDRLKTLFFTNVSHEFRTPLTLMLGPLEQELTKKTLPKEHLEQLELIHRNTLRLQRLVNNLLDFSSLEAGKLKVAFRPVEISAFTKELASSFQSAMDQAGLKYTVKCLPLEHKVYVDIAAWEKIVFNLLSNALKYALKGSVEVIVHQNGNFAELKVSDTGTGIPKSELPHLFERFHRVQGAKSRSFEGSGIGLAMVAELTKLHGGSITATSELGKGSTFVVRIPFGTTHLSKDQIDQTSTVARDTRAAKAYVDEAIGWVKQPTTQKELTKQEKAVKSRLDETILVVDDNADMREYIYRILNANTSLSVITVASGKAALKAIEKKLPSLIVSDIMMPEMDGFQLVNAIRKDPAAKHIPIIFLSARASEKQRVEGVAEGVDSYLVKPFSADELAVTVNTHLNLAQVRKKSVEEQTRALRQLNEVKDEFISIVSHQLRTPATGVKQYLGILREGMLGELTHQQKQALEHAYESNERQLSIIYDLLKVAQIDAGKIELKKKPTDLVKLTLEVLDELRAKTDAKNQIVSFIPPKKIIKPELDSQLIRMAIENLVDNASKYSSKHKTITIGLDFDEINTTWSIKDQGVGINNEDLPKLFKKFSRLGGSRNSTVDGNGIGLYWVKKVVDEHGGSIDVDSQPRKGSTFTVKLPSQVAKF